MANNEIAPDLQEEVPLKDEKLEDIKLKFLITQFRLFNRSPFSLASELVGFIQNLNAIYPRNSLMKCSLNRNIVAGITQKCINLSIEAQIFEDLKV